MQSPIFILGGGAVGLALAAHLARAGRPVELLRLRDPAPSSPRLAVAVHTRNERWTVTVPTAALAERRVLEGVVVVASKAHANRALAARLATHAMSGPLVVMQNGLGVEAAFERLPGVRVCRSVLYVSSERTGPDEVRFESAASSPVDPAAGRAIGYLHTPGFPFHAAQEIGWHIWRKTILNAVFNTLGPLLESDNGLFCRNPKALELARCIMAECIPLAAREGVALTENDLLEGVLRISRTSRGNLISTLQDIRHGRPTEMESLNLELARRASPAHPVPVTELLGRLTWLKAEEARRRNTPLTAPPGR